MAIRSAINHESDQYFDAVNRIVYPPKKNGTLKKNQTNELGNKTLLNNLSDRKKMKDH